MTLTQGTADTTLPHGSSNESTSLQYSSVTTQLNNVKLLNVTKWITILTLKHMALTKQPISPDFQKLPAKGSSSQQKHTTRPYCKPIIFISHYNSLLPNSTWIMISHLFCFYVQAKHKHLSSIFLLSSYWEWQIIAQTTCIHQSISVTAGAHDKQKRHSVLGPSSHMYIHLPFSQSI
jgi:hypothetical protein